MQNETQHNMEAAPTAHPHAKTFSRAAAALLIAAACLGTYAWYVYASTRIATDTAQISAPTIALSAHGTGTLDELFVHPGDRVTEDEVVARVGTELLKTKVAGEILSTNDDVGAHVAPGEPIITMIDRGALRVVVRIKEDKGLERIRPGQLATFTVDAFPGRTYNGVVDEVSPTSRDAGVLFTISDKREVKEFDVKIRFDADAYAELKNGMSSKVVIFTR